MIQPRIVAISQHRRSHLTRRPTRTPTRMATRAERGVACCRKQLGFGFDSMAMLISGGFLDLKDRRLYLYVCVCVSVSCTSEAVLDFLLGESMRCAKQCKANCNCFSQKYSDYKQCPGSDLGAVFKYLNRQQHCTQDEINVEERSMCFIEVTRLQRRHPSPEVYKYRYGHASNCLGARKH